MDYSKYRKHPRMVELRFALIHNFFVLELGIEKVAMLFKNICDAASMNWTLLSSVIGRKDRILALDNSDKLRYRQEVMFMGATYDENRIQTASRYLRISKRTLYSYVRGSLITENFVSEDWLDKLDYNTVIAGVDAYRIEMERFLNYITMISEVVSGVSLAKI